MQSSKRVDIQGGVEEERKEERESVTAYTPVSDVLLHSRNVREERVNCVFSYRRGSDI